MRLCASSSPCRTSDSSCTHCGLGLVKEAVAQCFVYFWCLVCFASEKPYSYKCFIFVSSFFFPPGLQQHGIWRLQSLDDVSLPASLWGQCHLHCADGKQTLTGSKWLTRRAAAFAICRVATTQLLPADPCLFHTVFAAACAKKGGCWRPLLTRNLLSSEQEAFHFPAH